MQYQTKVKQVEAYQFQSGGDELTKAHPKWLIQGLMNGTIKVTADGKKLEVNQTSGIFTANDGDWLVKNGAGEVCVVSDKQFRSDYEPVTQPG